MIRPGDLAAVIRGTEKGRVVRIEGNIAILEVDDFEMPFQVTELVRISGPSAGQSSSHEKQQGSYQQSLNLQDSGLTQATLGFRLLENEEKKAYQLHVMNPTGFTLLCRVFEEKNNHWVLLFEGKVEDRNYAEGPVMPETELGRLDQLLVQFVFTPVRLHVPCPFPVQVEYHGTARRMSKPGAFINTDGMKFYWLKSMDHLERELLTRTDLKEVDLPPPVKAPVAKGMQEEEIDLHIEELVDDIAGMTNHQMLQTQLRFCRQKIEDCLVKGTHKLNIIHGVGKGRLKEEVILLIKGYEGLRHEPASAQRFGRGALTVYFV
jgi:hypothetical protein